MGSDQTDGSIIQQIRSVCMSDLALPIGGVDEDDAVREVVIRHQDVVKLVVHGLSGDLWR